MERAVGAAERGAADVVTRHRPAMIGAVLATASLPAHLLLRPAASHQLAALLLVLVAGIYVGFALQDGRPRQVAVEALTASAFVSAAAAGLWLTPWVIPTAYILHGGWDIAHHRRVATAMPRWYIPFCATFDLVFAAGLIAAWLPRSLASA